MGRKQVTVPTGRVGGVAVEHFEVANDIANLRAALDGRSCRPGRYSRLVDENGIWMTDTDAEIRDHSEAFYRISQKATKRVLINGLGLGVVVQAALEVDHVEHVDVVEIDLRIIQLVGPHYACDRLAIHHANAYEKAKRWPRGTRWDVAWHDIWRDICGDNLPLMAKLHRAYGHRVGWQGSWSHARLKINRNGW